MSTFLHSTGSKSTTGAKKSTTVQQDGTDALRITKRSYNTKLTAQDNSLTSSSGGNTKSEVGITC